jgi:hypothetical protein
MFDTSDPRDRIGSTSDGATATHPIRWQLIAHLRAQIERGTYLTPRRWELAMQNLVCRELEGE